VMATVVLGDCASVDKMSRVTILAKDGYFNFICCRVLVAQMFFCRFAPIEAAPVLDDTVTGRFRWGPSLRETEDDQRVIQKL